MPCGSCPENTLQHFMSNIYDGLNAGKYTAGLFLDIKKAFDIVDHTILFDKFYMLAIRGVVYN